MFFFNVVLREVFVLFLGSGYLYSIGSRFGVFGFILFLVSEERLRLCIYYIF